MNNLAYKAAAHSMPTTSTSAYTYIEPNGGGTQVNADKNISMSTHKSLCNAGITV